MWCKYSHILGKYSQPIPVLSSKERLNDILQNLKFAQLCARMQITSQKFCPLKRLSNISVTNLGHIRHKHTTKICSKVQIFSKPEIPMCRMSYFSTENNQLHCQIIQKRFFFGKKKQWKHHGN